MSPLADEVLRRLAARTGRRDLRYARPPRRLGRGASADCYGFRLATAPSGLDGDLVIRLTKYPQVFRKEIVFQETLARLEFPTPRIHLAVEPGEGSARPFAIMDRAPGRRLAQRSGMVKCRRAAEVMSELHSIDPQPVIAALEEAGVSSEAVDVDAILTDLAFAERLPLSGFREGLAWLQRNRPRDSRQSVCHGDIHPLNVLIEGERVTALLDWTDARIADPAYDLAATYSTFSLVPFNGRRRARQFLRAYGQLQPLPEPTVLRWYLALHSFRILSYVAGWRLDRSLPVDVAWWELTEKGTATQFSRITRIALAIPSTRWFTAKWLGRLVLVQV